MKVKVFTSVGNTITRGPGDSMSLEVVVNQWLEKEKPEIIGRPLQTQTVSTKNYVCVTLTIFYEPSK